MEIRGLGGAAFARALAAFGDGTPVTYRRMTLALRAAELEVRVPAPSAAQPLTTHRALDLLTRARYRLGALLASAPPLEAAVGNRLPRLVLVDERHADVPLFELRGDRLRHLADPPDEE